MALESDSLLRSTVKSYLSKLVATEPYSSPTTPPSNEASQLLSETFSHIGMRPAIGDSFILDNNGWKTVLGIKGNGKGPTIMLTGHYDVAKDEGIWLTPNKHAVAFVPTQTSQELLHISDELKAMLGSELAIGKGTEDMLGEVASMLTAAERVTIPEDGTLLVMLVPDEEQRSKFGMSWALEQLQEHNMLPDFVIGGESTNLEVLTDRRGASLFTVTLPTREFPLSEQNSFAYQVVTHGENTHAGLFTMAKRNQHAIMNMSRFLSSLDGSTQVFSLDGGIATNVIPSSCKAVISTTEPIDTTDFEKEEVVITPIILERKARIALLDVSETLEAIGKFQPTVESVSSYDISILPNVIHGNNLQLVIRLMQGNFIQLEDELRSVLQQTHVLISPVASVLPFHENRDSELVHATLQTLENLDIPPRTRENHGTSDSNNFYPYRRERGGKIKGVIEIGGTGLNEHSQNEWVDVDSLVTLTQVYLGIIALLVNKQLS